MWTQLEVFQRLDSRFRGNHKQGGNDEGDTFPRTLIRNWGAIPSLARQQSMPQAAYGHPCKNQPMALRPRLARPRKTRLRLMRALWQTASLVLSAK